jgi:hypothetical protein
VAKFRIFCNVPIKIEHLPQGGKLSSMHVRGPVCHIAQGRGLKGADIFLVGRIDKPQFITFTRAGIAVYTKAIATCRYRRTLYPDRVSRYYENRHW